MKTNPLELTTASDSRPPELLVSGPELDETIAHLKRQGARVAAVETVRGCTDLWRTRLHWDETAP